MSALSLNRLCNGSGSSNNKFFNFKFGRNSSTLPTMRHVPKIDINNNDPQPALRKRHLLNRRGSLYHNQFKGVKKDLIEKQANLIVHTMTVKIDHVTHVMFLIFPPTPFCRLKSSTRKFSMKFFTMSAVMNQRSIMRNYLNICRRLLEFRRRRTVSFSRRRDLRKLQSSG